MYDDDRIGESYNPDGDPIPPPPSTPASPWTDPDNAAPDWLHDPNADMSARTLPPGLRWVFQDGMWQTVQMPRAQQTPGPPTSPTGTPGEDYPTTYGGPSANSGGFDYGRPMGNQFSSYREMDPFVYSGGPFSFAQFAPTNRNDLYNEQLNPGFVKSQERLQKMIEAGAAYKGVLRSGNTFNELGSILGNNEEQQFGAFDNRRFRDWTGNRDNAADAWSRNVGVEQFAYGQRAEDNNRFNNYRFNTEKSTADDLLSRWQELVRATTQLSRPV